MRNKSCSLSNAIGAGATIARLKEHKTNIIYVFFHLERKIWVKYSSKCDLQDLGKKYLLITERVKIYSSMNERMNNN